MSLRTHSLVDRIQEQAQSKGDQTAFVCGTDALTFADYADQVLRAAAGLRAQGLAPGDRVAVLLDNGLETAVAYGACMAAGLIAVGLNTRTAAEEMAQVLEITTPRLLLSQERFLETTQVLQKTVPQQVRVDGSGASWKELLAHAPLADPATDPTQGCVIIPTAAVGGVPKGALLSQQNLQAACQVHLLHFGADALSGHLGVMPLFHVMGLTSLWASFLCGGKTVLLPQFDPQVSVQAIDQHQLTYFGSFPPILGRILEAAQESGSVLPSLKLVYGLEGPDGIQRLHQETQATFWTGFGQAETSAFVTVAPATERPGSSGRASWINSVAVVNEADERLPAGEAGEIVVRGENIMLEYWGHPEATAHVFRNDWHHTGDIGRLDADGYLHYVKRKAEKELIKTGGENVYPGEVEAVLLRHPDVAAACVIGVPDATWGESVKALCVRKPGATVEAEALRAFVGSQIAGFKRPRLIEFVPELPGQEAGEIDREAVKAQYGAQSA